MEYPVSKGVRPVPGKDKTHEDDVPKRMLEEYYRPPRETQEFIFDVYDKLIRWRSLRENQ